MGDAGAVLTTDKALADRVRRLRNGGQATRYDHVEVGVNSRLDELQAAVLRARLPFLRRWTARRQALAALYRARLTAAPVVVPPELDPGHVYHLFPVQSSERPALQAHLSSQGFDTLIHYPVPITRLPAMAVVDPTDCPVANQLCDEILSLPLYPSLTDDDVIAAAEAVCRFSSRRGAGVGH
jgi:dTDP-3-amino-3,4,6-trideoxy-alpha-D-glucose transaminase